MRSPFNFAPPKQADPCQFSFLLQGKKQRSTATIFTSRRRAGEGFCLTIEITGSGSEGGAGKGGGGRVLTFPWRGGRGWTEVSPAVGDVAGPGRGRLLLLLLLRGEARRSGVERRGGFVGDYRWNRGGRSGIYGLTG